MHAHFHLYIPVAHQIMMYCFVIIIIIIILLLFFIVTIVLVLTYLDNLHVVINLNS